MEVFWVINTLNSILDLMGILNFLWGGATHQKFVFSDLGAPQYKGILEMYLNVCEINVYEVKIILF